MTEGEEYISDAMYQVARQIEKMHNDISVDLRHVAAQIEDIVNALEGIARAVSEINKAMPNPLDVPE